MGEWPEWGNGLNGEWPQWGKGFRNPVSPPLGGLGTARGFHRIPTHVEPRQWIPMEFVMHAASPDRMSPDGTKTPSPSPIWLRAIALTSAAILMASCNEGVLDPHG